jgi:exopolyphosphatase/guanosine-5'-triphosphate,3'-diphosphate pyrophosphatase
MLLQKVIKKQIFPSKKQAVIDIGSNSIRMLIYEDFESSQIPIFNEKAVCSLGSSLEKTGKLDTKGAKYSVSVLERFKNILDNSRVSDFHVFATAAVRDAEDGEQFKEIISKIFNKDVEVLTGEQEAERSALGVMLGFDKVNGLVADLGGGSLEIAKVKNGNIEHKTSLPIGVLRLFNRPKKKNTKLEDIVSYELSKIAWLKKTKIKNLYLVGGVWRALLKADIFLKEYPLNVLHQYELSKEDVLKLCNSFNDKKKIVQKKIDQITKSRTDYIPSSCTILDKLVNLTGPDKIKCSISGVREGTLIKKSNSKLLEKDRLGGFIEYASFRSGDYGENYLKYFNFIEGIFQDNENFSTKLLKSTCSLSNMDWGLGAFQKAELVFSQILNTPVLNLSHNERVKIALAGFWRHCSIKYYPDLNFVKLLSNNEILISKQVGAALRLASGIAAISTIFLDNLSLAKTSNTLLLTVPNDHSQIITKTVLKRLKVLAKAMDAEYKILYS